MSAMESFLLGVMVAWTPSLAAMVWLLASALKTPTEDELAGIGDWPAKHDSSVRRLLE